MTKNTLTLLVILAFSLMANATEERSKADSKRVKDGIITLTIYHWNLSDSLQYIQMAPDRDLLYPKGVGDGAIYGRFNGSNDWVKLESKVRLCGFGELDPFFACARPTKDPKEENPHENVIPNDHYNTYDQNEEKNSVRFQVTIRLEYFSEHTDKFLASFEDFRLEYPVYHYDPRSKDFLVHHKAVSDPFEMK